jgi:cell wall-associated NlpC family hydrolase
VPGLSSVVAAQLATLEGQITQTGQLLDALAQAEAENATALVALNGRIAATRTTMAIDQQDLVAARLELRRQALADYMDDVGSTGLTSLLSGFTEDAAFQEYRTLAAGDENGAITRFSATWQTATAKEATLTRDEAALSATLGQIAVARQSALAAASVEQADLATLNSQSGPLGSAFAAVQRAGIAALNALTAPGSLSAGSVPAAVLAALTHAGSQLSVPYVWGGETPGPGPGAGFDCSGLVQWAYGAAGIALPRTAAEQYQAVAQVPVDQIRPGDLVFWNDGTTSVEHVAIYVGSGLVLQAPATGSVVSYSSIWSNGLVGFGRPD